MPRTYIANLLIVACTLTGCASMPVTSMYKLHRLDPMEADPAQIKVAVRADKRIGIRQGGAQIELGFDAEDGSLQVDETYVVEIVHDPIMTPELLEDKGPGESITVLHLSESDARRMSHVQSLMKTYEKTPGRGSLGVNLSGICLHGPIPGGPVPVDIFLQTSIHDGFFVFVRNLDLRERFDQAGVDLEVWPECAGRLSD